MTDTELQKLADAGDQDAVDLLEQRKDFRQRIRGLPVINQHFRESS